MGLNQRKSKEAHAIFSDLENQDKKSNHFGFGFITKNVSDLLRLCFTLIDDQGNQVEFHKNEEKVPILSFETQVIQKDCRNKSTKQI